MQKVFILIGTIVVVIIISIFVLLILAILGSVMYSGCYYRYSNPDGTMLNTATVILQANGRYDGVTCAPGDANCPVSKYGQWVKANLNVKSGATINMTVNGQVSLCQGYTTDATRTPIPRVSSSTTPLAIILPANANTQTIANVYASDQVQISVGLNSHNSNQNVYDITTKSNIIANCSDGQTKYNPICGKYSIYSGFKYYTSNDCSIISPSDCGASMSSRDRACNDQTGYKFFGDSVKGGCCDEFWGVCYGYKHTSTCYKIVPPSSTYNQAYTNTAVITSNSNCVTSSTITNNNSNYTYTDLVNNACPATPNISNLSTWFTFDSGITNAVSGLTYAQNSVIQPNQPGCSISIFTQSTNTPPAGQAYIFDSIVNANGPISYKFFTPESSGSYTGGYVVYIKQTKCFRKNGSFQDDPADPANAGCNKRGQIQALLLAAGQDPNLNDSLASNPTNLVFDTTNGSLTSPITANQAGYLWFKINNSQNDYPNSSGQYSISVNHQHNNSTNKNQDTWNWITSLFFDKWQAMAKTMFQNMTCYAGSNAGSSNQADCTNLFNVIKACLIGYLMIFGAMFALGTVQINNIDFINRILKLVIVGGLMNQNTFDFFNQYLFDLVFQSTAQIMSATISPGTTLESSLNSFFSSIYGVIFSDIFQIQLLALLGTGLMGISFFILVIISLVLFLIPVVEFIVIYVGSSLLLAVLMSLSPIFLTFMLFDITRYLFDNWIKFIIRYMFEPAIMFIGLSLLTQLFLIYIDYVLGFSVCWKCNAPFQIPFLDQIFPFLANLKTVPIFCIYWLSPWGYDPISYNFASSMTNVAALFIISFTTWRYANLSSQICDSIFGVSTPTSLTAMTSRAIKTMTIQTLDQLKPKITPQNNQPTQQEAKQTKEQENKQGNNKSAEKN